MTFATEYVYPLVPLAATVEVSIISVAPDHVTLLVVVVLEFNWLVAWNTCVGPDIPPTEPLLPLPVFGCGEDATIVEPAWNSKKVIATGKFDPLWVVIKSSSPVAVFVHRYKPVSCTAELTRVHPSEVGVVLVTGPETSATRRFPGEALKAAPEMTVPKGIPNKPRLFGPAPCMAVMFLGRAKVTMFM
jgi:hypothetical protein